MVLICWPRDPPASASQSAGITDVSHCVQPFLAFSTDKTVQKIYLRSAAVDTQNYVSAYFVVGTLVGVQRWVNRVCLHRLHEPVYKGFINDIPAFRRWWQILLPQVWENLRHGAVVHTCNSYTLRGQAGRTAWAQEFNQPGQRGEAAFLLKIQKLARHGGVFL